MTHGDRGTEKVWLGRTGPAVAVGLGLLVIQTVRPRRPTATEAHKDDEIGTIDRARTTD